MPNIIHVTDEQIGESEKKLSPRIAEITALAAMEVENDDQAAQATDVIKKIGGLVKGIEDERVAITKPINEGLRVLNAKFKVMTAPLEKAAGGLRETLQGYLELKAAQEREAKRISDARELKAAQEAFEAEKAKHPNPEVMPATLPAIAAPPPAPAPVTRVRGDTGALSSLKKVWDYEVTDIKKLAAARPDLIQANQKYVENAIKAGEREIEGLRIFQRDVLQVR